MFDEMKKKLKEKYGKDRTVKTEREGDYVKDFFTSELADLEKLLLEEVKLKEMAQEKKREIDKAIEGLGEKISSLKEKLEKMRYQFKDILKDKEIESEQIKIELTGEEKELNNVREDEENEIKSQQTEWELRLQSKEEENNLLKNQIRGIEEELQTEREKKDQEIQELKQQLEQMSGGQESV